MYLSPKSIISDFLRIHLTDPRARAEATTTESFTATASQTEFSLTALSGSVSCITSITVNSTAKTKWVDYYYDQRNEKVIFFNGLTLSDSVEITYKYGTSNWIFDDKPRTNLSVSSFPRIDVKIVSSPAKRLGNYEAPVEGDIRFQMDIWTKEAKSGGVFTIDSRAYTGDELAEYLAYQITKAFEDHEDDLHPALYNYEPVGMPTDLPFAIDYQCHHKVVEIVMKGLDLGRVE